MGVLIPQASAEAPIKPPVAQKWASVAPANVDLALEVATRHGLDVKQFVYTVGCESSFNSNAVGDNGTSFGLAQLHNPVRDWGITVQEAKNPHIALEVMAQAWERGEQWRWTCWQLKYGKG